MENEDVFADDRGNYEDREHQEISERIARLLGPDVKRRVESAIKTWNQRIRASLRDATGLRLSHGKRTESVPIRVVPELPYPLVEILRPWHRNLEEWQTLDVTSLATTRDTLVKIIRSYSALVEALDYSTPRQDPRANRDQISATKDFVDQIIELKKIDWGPIWPEPTDPEKPSTTWDPWEPFGSYSLRPPCVRIHWVAIGVFASMCEEFHYSSEQLTAVVLAHELAHAYTHVGFDTDGNQWRPDEKMLGSDIHIIEGLAQFYTEVFCNRQNGQAPELLGAFNDLLEIQRNNDLTWYTCFENWAKEHGHRNEIIRVAMIETRTRGIQDYQDYLSLIKTYEDKWPQPPEEASDPN